MANQLIGMVFFLHVAAVVLYAKTLLILHVYVCECDLSGVFVHVLLC